MRKILTMFFTGAFLIALMSMTAFAATGWQKTEADEWRFLDKEGEAVSQEWKKSGENWYWLDEDGKLAVAQKVEDGDNFYFVNEEGVMVKNAWVDAAKAYADDDLDRDSYWMYFTKNGKAYKDGWRTIDGQKYHFTDSLMDYEFLDENGVMISGDDAWKTATYYCGDANNGAMFKGWVKVENSEAGDGYSWIYFDNNGKKVIDGKKKINGLEYLFDAEGVMLVEFNDATVSSAPVSKYYKEDGSLVKKGWIYAYLTEDADEQNWFYANAQGILLKDCVKKIDGKFYAFDSEGRMLTGFVYVVDGVPVSEPQAAEDTVKANMFDATANYMYFAENEDINLQGPARVGKSNVEVSDGIATILFSNSKGIAEDNGEVVKDNYFYINSVLYNFDDAEFKYEARVINGVQYVINLKSGRAYKKGTFTDSENDIRYILKDGILTTQHKNADNKWN